MSHLVGQHELTHHQSTLSAPPPPPLEHATIGSRLASAMATRVRLASALSSPLLFGPVGQQVAAPAWSASACAATLLAARRGLARVSPASIPAPACTGVGAAAAREAARWASTSAGRAAVSGQVGAAATAAASTGAAAAAGRSVLARARELLGDYKQLSKLRLSLLVVSTASGGYVLGSPEEVDWAGLCWVSLGTLGAAASANTLNQVRSQPAPAGGCGGALVGSSTHRCRYVSV